MASFPKQGHNLILLALMWFATLLETETITPENEDSVALARAVAREMGGLDEATLISQARNTPIPREMIKVVDDAHEIDTAIVLARYLSSKKPQVFLRQNDADWAGPNYQPFLQAMASEPRTIQQSFTRLMMRWCWFLDKKYVAGSASETAVLARKICACDRALPYI